MATVKSLQMTAPRYPVSGPGMGGRSLKVERGVYNGAALAAGDVIELFKLHPRFRVVGGYVKTDGMGASVTITVGDADDADRYFTTASVASSAINVTLASTGLDYITTKYTTVTATTAGATSNGTGTLTVVLYGIIEEPA